MADSKESSGIEELIGRLREQGVEVEIENFALLAAALDEDARRLAAGRAGDGQVVIPGAAEAAGANRWTASAYSRLDHTARRGRNATPGRVSLDAIGGNWDDSIQVPRHAGVGRDLSRHLDPAVAPVR